MKIKNISARKILASQGDETVEATIEFADGKIFSASVPAGISAGQYEIAKVSADKAISQIGQISPIVSGKDWTQKKLDEEISSHGFGGNATLAVSAAFFKNDCTLNIAHCSFPKLMLLLFEGGKHGSKSITIQEFLLIEDTVEEALKDFEILHNYLVKNGIETLVGAEGGFSPNNLDNNSALNIIKELFPNKKISLDIAASFGVIPNYSEFLGNYNLLSIEDPFSDTDWDRWQAFFNRYSSQILIVGDDLTTTNPDRIQKAIDQKAINAVVIKPNQIGTISGALKAVEVARQAGLKIIVSHRGEETNDAWIVDFAIAVNADYVKFGGMDRGERIAKYNRLLALQTSQSPHQTDS